MLHPIIVALRGIYWKYVRRYQYEICGTYISEIEGGPRIRWYGCGRPVGLVWQADTAFWNRMITGKPLPPGRTEGAGGILCISCFDDLCNERGEPRFWKADPL